MTSTATKYLPCSTENVPAGIRFDTPRQNQGQIVEVSYGTFGRAAADRGDKFMRRIDHSTGETTYYIEADEAIRIARAKVEAAKNANTTGYTYTRGVDSAEAVLAKIEKMAAEA